MADKKMMEQDTDKKDNITVWLKENTDGKIALRCS